jgi:hypothetical protein
MSRKWFLLLLLPLLFLGAWQVPHFRALFGIEPSAVVVLQQEVAAWLAQETPLDATLLASAELGRITGRETVTLSDAPPAEQAAQLAASLSQNPVDFVVVENTLAWDLIQEALWFRLNYSPVKTFTAPGVTTAPVTIYAYRPLLANLGPRHTLNARVPDRLSVLGYQLGPEILQAGETAQVLLALQAPKASIVPRRPFDALLRLASPLDGSTMAEWSVELPRSVDPAAWAPAQVIDELIALPLPPDLPSGAYQLTLSLRDDEDTELWPFSFNNDVNRLDRIPLAWLTVPQAGQPLPQRPLNAGFDDSIILSGVTTSAAVPGSDLSVTLAWQPVQAIGEDFIVFVHLLDASGNLVAGHDGRPAAGRFPTPAWRPGLTVTDTHFLPLPADLPPGTYTLRAGLYDPQSGARLLLTTLDSQPAAGDAAELGTIELR